MKWGMVKAWWDSHHETEGGSGEPLEIPVNEVFTFQGRPDKWGFTVLGSELPLASETYATDSTLLTATF